MKVKELVKILLESGDQEAPVKVGWFGGPVEEPGVGIVIFPSDAYVVIAPAGSIVTEKQILLEAKRPKRRSR